MDMREFKLATGERVTLDKGAISFYGPHPSGSGTHMVVGPVGSGMELHLADNYPQVRHELTMSIVDRAVRSMRSSRHDDAVREAEHYATSLWSKHSVKVHIVDQEIGLRIEVDHPLTSRHGEDALSWDELDAEGEGALRRVIDELVAVVAPPAD